MEFKEEILKSLDKGILFTRHALDQMDKPERLITPREVILAVKEGEIIEDYPADPRGHSCLMMRQISKERTIHVVCAPKKDYLAIITAYIPNLNEWEKDYKKRKR